MSDLPEPAARLARAHLLRLLGRHDRPAHHGRPRAVDHARLALHPRLPAAGRRLLLHLLRPRLEGRGAAQGLDPDAQARRDRGDGADLRAQRRRHRALRARVGRHHRRAHLARHHQPRTWPRCCRPRRSSSSSPAQDKFARLKEDLAGAQRFIHLQYFIWEQDELTAEIVPILLDRLEAGVEVRIMYDWMGCISFKKRELKQLAQGRRRRARRRHRPPAHQLPQPPQDRRHRRRDRLHRRHERRPGVHRRRRALRHLARHPPAPHRARPWPASRSCTRRAGSSTRRTTRTSSRRSTCRRPTRRPSRRARWSRSPRRGSKTPGARRAAPTWSPSARRRSRCGSSRRTSSPTTASTTS